MRVDAGRHAALVAAVARVAREAPVGHKFLVCAERAEGFELLRAAERAGIGWIGFEVAKPAHLAHTLVALELADAGLVRADQFDELRILDEALDAVIAAGDARAFAALAEGTGFRDAIRRTVEALRLEGIAPAALRAAPLEDSAKRAALAAVLEAYERGLAEEGKADAAEVFRRAVAGLETGRLALPDARIFLLPGLELRGLPGRFIGLLLERGATVLETDAVAGPEAVAAATAVAAPAAPPAILWRSAPPAPARAPALDLFAAASPVDELREVLRRILAAGLAWDEVEIIATDDGVYGPALDSLARRLGIPATHARGLPVERTRPGRALAGYLRWIQEDCRADVLRRMLEAGELAPPGEPAPPGDHGDVTGVALARRLRRLRVGWGRDRYGEAIDRALARLDAEPEPPADPEDDRSADELRAERLRERRELEALEALLGPLLDPSLPLPDRSAPAAVRVSPAALAEQLLAVLACVPIDRQAEPADAAARDHLRARLERAAATLDRETSFAAATAVLWSRLAVRVPAVDDAAADETALRDPAGHAAAGHAAAGRDAALDGAGDGDERRTAPWRSTPGRLHFADLETGGFTGRKATFIVGLDAGRFPGGGVQDPLLTDADRRRLSDALRVGDPARLPLATTAERIAEARFRLDALLARLRGRVTLAFSAWDPAEARRVAPAAAVLQAFRLRERDRGASYDDLRRALGDLASAVPRNGARLDAADVWLAALAGGDGVPLAGGDVVGEAFPGLARGLAARAARSGAALTAHHGRIAPRPRLDPRGDPEALVSASRLEALGACPLRYLHRYGLGLRPPDAPAYEPDRWLDAKERGILLHRVFERSLREARAAGVDVAADAFLALALRLLDAEAARMRERVPPPSEAVHARELDELRDDVRVFVEATRAEGARWLELELRFGRSGRPPVELPLPGGAIRLEGAIDRVDEHAAGELVVIDYKTGTGHGYGRAPFRGGRRLQHFLYARAAEALLGRRVARMEYRFPTRRGRADRARYGRDALEAGGALVDALLDMAAAGHLLPTDDAADCTWCDYGRCCRVADDGWRTASPLAEWAKRRAGELEEYAPLRRAREEFA